MAYNTNPTLQAQRAQQRGVDESVPIARATRDAQAVVAAMHELAVRSAIPVLTTQDLKEMRAANRRFAAALKAGDAETALAADDELHGIPVRAGGNAAVRDVLDQFTPVLRRVERMRFSSLDARDSVTLHDRLIDLCEAGDGPAAAAVSTQTWQTLTPPLDDGTLDVGTLDHTEAGNP